MELLLTDACEHQPKPTIAFVGATIQPDLAGTASNMVRLMCPSCQLVLYMQLLLSVAPCCLLLNMLCFIAKSMLRCLLYICGVMLLHSLLVAALSVCVQFTD